MATGLIKNFLGDDADEKVYGVAMGILEQKGDFWDAIKPVLVEIQASYELAYPVDDK